MFVYEKRITYLEKYIDHKVSVDTFVGLTAVSGFGSRTLYPVQGGLTHHASLVLLIHCKKGYFELLNPLRTKKNIQYIGLQFLGTVQ